MDFKAASFGNLILHPPYFEYAEKSLHVKHLMPTHRRTCQPIKAAVTIMVCEVLNGPSYTSEHDRWLPAYTVKRQCLVLRQSKWAIMLLGLLTMPNVRTAHSLAERPLNVTRCALQAYSFGGPGWEHFTRAIIRSFGNGFRDYSIEHPAAVQFTLALTRAHLE